MTLTPEEMRMRERIFQELLDEEVFEHVDPEEAGITEKFFNRLEGALKILSDRLEDEPFSPEELLGGAVMYAYIAFRGSVPTEEAMMKVGMITAHLENLQLDRLEEWAMLARLMGRV